MWIGGALALAWCLVHWQAPLVEDSLFWWVPKGIKAGEVGFPLSPAGDLPAAMVPQAAMVLPSGQAVSQTMATHRCGSGGLVFTNALAKPQQHQDRHVDSRCCCWRQLRRPRAAYRFTSCWFCGLCDPTFMAQLLRPGWTYH